LDRRGILKAIGCAVFGRFIGRSTIPDLYRDPVPVTGTWLRIMDGRAQLLLEIDGRWRLINDESDGVPVSHITNPGGIRERPLDPWTETTKVTDGC
jgi:hypothetical protein